MRRQYTMFLLVISVLLVYTTYRLHNAIGFSLEHSTLLTIPLFILMFGGFFLSRSKPLVNDAQWFKNFSIIGTFAMGFWSIFIIFSLMSDLFRILVLGIYNQTQSEGLYYQIIIYYFDKINFYIPIASCLIVLLGFLEVLRGPVIKKISVYRDNINIDLNQFKIAQISDLHIGTSIRASYVNKVILKTNALNPDIIVITGDLIDGSPQALSEIIRLLSQLKAKFGIYYVVGNHEYYWGIESVLNSLHSTGITILLNENKIISIQKTQLMIAGITDPAARSIHPSHSPDIKKTSEGVDAADFKILLAHQPYIFSLAQKNGFDLQLSGHTHAGQFFPFNLFIGIAHKYYRGLHLHKTMHVYVNPGTGYWGPINRFGIPAEITLLQLLQKQTKE